MRVPRTFLALGLAAAVLAGCGTPAPRASAWVPPPAASTPPGAPASEPGRDGPPLPVPGKVMLGAYLDLAGMDEAQSLSLRRQQLGRDLRILHKYYQWTDPLPDSTAGVPDGAILLISWDGTAYAPVNNGSQDGLIAAAADALARYRRPVFLRWAWEMNGDWFDWGGPKNGNNPAGYIAAWRHLHDIFVAHGATNVAWVWGPNAGSVPAASWNDMARYYPGDQYVDWVGVSGYLMGRETPDSLFDGIVRNYGSRKPVMLAETGAVEKGGSVKADWIDQLARWVVGHPSVAAVVWFDTDNDKGTGKNWRIDSTPAALAAYQRLAADPHFAG
jgi:Glycosyl hydrolase family 26